MRITADVNILISSTIASLGIPREIITSWRKGELGLVISTGIISEVNEKLHYPRIQTRYKLTEQYIQTAIATFKANSELIPISFREISSITGDPEDDYVLVTAVKGRVDYLVTGDIKLQNLKKYKDVKIVSPRDFIEILRKK